MCYSPESSLFPQWESEFGLGVMIPQVVCEAVTCADHAEAEHALVIRLLGGRNTRV